MKFDHLFPLFEETEPIQDNKESKKLQDDGDFRQDDEESKELDIDKENGTAQKDSQIEET